MNETWHDYLDQASELIEKGFVNMDEVDLAKKLFLINSSDGEEEAATSSPPKHN
jgi:hypothetical protein